MGFWFTAKETKGGCAERGEAGLAGDDLLVLLKEMGYAPSEFRRPDGTLHGCKFTARVGDWSTNVHVFHGAQFNTINVLVTLKAIPDPDALPAVYYRRLLTANDLVTPAYYFYLQDLGGLFLVERFPNRGVTRAVLNQKIDDLLKLAHGYREHWDPA